MTDERCRRRRRALLGSRVNLQSITYNSDIVWCYLDSSHPDILGRSGRLVRRLLYDRVQLGHARLCTLVGDKCKSSDAIECSSLPPASPQPPTPPSPPSTPPPPLAASTAPTSRRPRCRRLHRHLANRRSFQHTLSLGQRVPEPSPPPLPSPHATTRSIDCWPAVRLNRGPTFVCSVSV